MRGKVLFKRTECQQPVKELLPYLISIKYQEREKEWERVLLDFECQAGAGPGEVGT